MTKPRSFDPASPPLLNKLVALGFPVRGDQIEGRDVNVVLSRDDQSAIAAFRLRLPHDPDDFQNAFMRLPKLLDQGGFDYGEPPAAMTTIIIDGFESSSLAGGFATGSRMTTERRRESYDNAYSDYELFQSREGTVKTSLTEVPVTPKGDIAHPTLVLLDDISQNMGRTDASGRDEGDLTGDGVVDIRDFDALATREAPPPDRTPEVKTEPKAGKKYLGDEIDPDDLITLRSDDVMENCTLYYNTVVFEGERIKVRRVHMIGAREERTNYHYRSAMSLRHLVDSTIEDVLLDHTSRGLTIGVQSPNHRVQNVLVSDVKGVGGWHPNNGCEFFLIEESRGVVADLDIRDLKTTNWNGPTFQVWRMTNAAKMKNIRVAGVRSDDGAVVILGAGGNDVHVRGVSFTQGFVRVVEEVTNCYVEGQIGRMADPFAGVRNQDPGGQKGRWRELMPTEAVVVDPQGDNACDVLVGGHPGHPNDVRRFYLPLA